MNDQDLIWINRAIEISEQCKPYDEAGRPAPKVGAVAVDAHGRFLCEAYRGGRDPREHAEYIVIDEARKKGLDLTGATIYTTLEPCTERGPEKLPCADRLAQSKVSRVCIGIIDPNIDVRHEGCKKLIAAQKTIEFFDDESKAKIEELNVHFIKYIYESGGLPVPRQIYNSFYYSNIGTDPSDVRELVLQHWAHRIGISNNEYLQINELNLSGDVRPMIRNSRRWSIRGANRVWMLKEIKRKAIADAKRVHTKHLLLNWLVSANLKGFKTKSPLPPTGVPKGQYYVSAEDGTGTIYELFEMAKDCDTTYEQVASFSVDSIERLAGLLVELDIIWKRICAEEEHLKVLLLNRFSKEHQFEYLDSSIERVRELKDALCAFHGFDSAVCIVASEVYKTFSMNSNRDDALLLERSKLGKRLVHGDLTEDNIMVDRTDQKATWLFDWDSVRAIQTGPFDLAFALVRLGVPNRKNTPIRVTDREISESRLILSQYMNTYSERIGNLNSNDFKQSLFVAFEDVKIEFCFRMVEYFELLNARQIEAPDVAYIKRCNPARVDQIQMNLL